MKDVEVLPAAKTYRADYVSPRAEVVSVFWDCNMSKGHDALAEMARKKKILVNRLAPGQYVLFVNHTRDRVKLYAANNVLIYWKSPHGPVNRESIVTILAALKHKEKLYLPKDVEQSVNEHLPEERDKEKLN